MRTFLQKILIKPVTRWAEKYSSRPEKDRVFKALSELYAHIVSNPGKKGPLINCNKYESRLILLSDQHKGAKTPADDFALCEANYLAALDYYYSNNYHYINLGDSEELWENTIAAVKKHNIASFESEARFLKDNRFVKLYGNHDLDWGNDPLAPVILEEMYNGKIPIYEGAVLRINHNNENHDIFLTHGHQGDRQSDGNWFSKWFVAKIWAPLQAYLNINPNTPANNDQLKNAHNAMMYEWSSAQQNLVLVTGHTHQPVFYSLTHLERLYKQLAEARKKNDTETIKAVEKRIKRRIMDGESLPDFTGIRPTYFNTGCCCFNDGDITGIEISRGCIRLIRWKYVQKESIREVLEEIEIEKLLNDCNIADIKTQ